LHENRATIQSNLNHKNAVFISLLLYLGLIVQTILWLKSDENRIRDLYQLRLN